MANALTSANASSSAGKADIRERSADLKAKRAARSKSKPAEAPGLIADLHGMIGGVRNDDGTVTFCDASGRVLRKPVAEWVSFTAMRMFAEVRTEMARQLEDPSLDDDARQALSTELRQSLRFDAVGILAFRAEAAFQVAQAGHEGAIPQLRRPAAGAVSVELEKAVRAHSEATQLALHDPIQSEERSRASLTRLKRLADAVRNEPARSLADLRHKVIYLWPSSLSGQRLKGGLAATLQSFREDVFRLAAEDQSEKADEAAR